jgi:hypothetical protein
MSGLYTVCTVLKAYRVWRCRTGAHLVETASPQALDAFNFRFGIQLIIRIVVEDEKDLRPWMKAFFDDHPCYPPADNLHYCGVHNRLPVLLSDVTIDPVFVIYGQKEGKKCSWIKKDPCRAGWRVEDAGFKGLGGHKARPCTKLFHVTNQTNLID